MSLLRLHIVALIVLVSPFVAIFGQQRTAHSVDKKKPRIDVNIYPNPVEDYFHLSTVDDIKYISISNIAGKEVKRFLVRGKEDYSILDLRKGIYIVRIFDTRDEPVKVVRLSKS